MKIEWTYGEPQESGWFVAALLDEDGYQRVMQIWFNPSASPMIWRGGGYTGGKSEPLYHCRVVAFMPLPYFGKEEVPIAQEHNARHLDVALNRLNERMPVIANEIKMERVRQIRLWGDDRLHPDLFARIMGEEFGEVCRAIDNRDWENCREELIQLAAVCVRFVQNMELDGVLPKDETAHLRRGIRQLPHK